MKVYLTNALYFDLNGISDYLKNKLIKTFRVKSPEYIKADNKKVFGDDEKYITMYTIKDNKMFLPRGCSNELFSILSEEIDRDDIELIDKRLLLDKIEFPVLNIKLFKHQQKIIKLGSHISQGTVQAGCGSGKTIALIGLIAKCGQPALVIVPNDTSLLNQWIENIEKVFGIKYGDRNDYIGIIGDGKYDYENKHIVVAMAQSIYSHRDDKKLLTSFGFVCMDECHMVGARTFRTSIHLFPAYYRFGVTATLFRNDNLTTFIEDYCGKCFKIITDEELENNKLLIIPKMYKRDTKFKFKPNYMYKNWYNTMVKYLMSNKPRNRLIIDDIINNSIKPTRLALVVSTRVNHCVIIAQMLQEKIPDIKMGILVGEEIKNSKLDYDNIVTCDVERKARNGELDIVFGVDKVKQGLDIPPIEDVYIVAPRKSQVDITQIVGRAMRPDDCFGKYKNKSDKQPRIYDYVDVCIDVLFNQYNEWRLPVYESRCEIVKVANRRNNRKEKMRNGK